MSAPTVERAGLALSKGVLFAMLLTSSSTAWALDSDAARERAQYEVTAVEAEVSKVSSAPAAGGHKSLPAERLAAGELLFRTRDYDRAIDELDQVAELHRQGKAGPNAYFDATFLLGESYFADNQLLAAKRQYWLILEQGPSSPAASYAGRALARLVDVALRTGNLDGLSAVFAKLDQLASDASGSIDYARAKAYLAKKDYAAAKAAVARVQPSSEYHHQAQYLLGVALMKEELASLALAGQASPALSGAGAAPAAAKPGEAAPLRFSSAVVQFQKVTTLPPDTAEHRHVIDLAWMALGRLLYESESYLEAAEAYSHVDRASAEFNDMLYELSWVYVRLGDYKRAQRALEVLAIASPETLDFADGTLLRADLMLRSGEYTPALELYESVRNRFDPVRSRVDEFLDATNDPAIYYDKLVEDPIEGQQGEALPQIVLTWVREAAQDDRVFALIDDVTRSRDLIRHCRRIVQKLDGLLASSTRSKAFPEMQEELEQATGLINRLGQSRRLIAVGLEDEDDSGLSGEIGTVRAERRQLMKRMAGLPVTPGDFLRREQVGELQWNELSQRLQGVTLEADRLQAMVNGLRRVLREGEKQGVTASAESVQRFQLEVEANERDLQIYRNRIDAYREAIAAGRVQIGFGDQRFVDDEQVRERFKVVLARELSLASAGAAGSDLAEYARSVAPILVRADQAEQRLVRAKDALNSRVTEEAAVLRQVVEEEAAKVEVYSERLDALDQHSRVLIGEVAMKNFGMVRDRLKGIVLRADVGVVQQAWEIREQQKRRLLDLQRERAMEEQSLNDELREVLDDTEEQ